MGGGKERKLLPIRTKGWSYETTWNDPGKSEEPRYLAGPLPYRILETLALQVEHRLAELEIAGRTLTLKVRWSTFELVTRASSREQGFQLAQEMLPVLRTLLSGLVDGKRAVRLLGVTVSSLVSPNEMWQARQIVTPSLWQDEQVQV